MKELMALIGHLLVRWGWLEAKLAGQPPPIEIDPVRLMRNAICHGIISADADPYSGSEAHIRCRTREGSVAVYAASEIDKAISTLERVGGGLPAVRLDG